MQSGRLFVGQLLHVGDVSLFVQQLLLPKVQGVLLLHLVEGGGHFLLVFLVLLFLLLVVVLLLFFELLAKTQRVFFLQCVDGCGECLAVLFFLFFLLSRIGCRWLLFPHFLHLLQFLLIQGLNLQQFSHMFFFGRLHYFKMFFQCHCWSWSSFCRGTFHVVNLFVVACSFL